MMTSGMSRKKKVKICSNCRHFQKKPFSIGCHKWTKKADDERFFYSPNSLYVNTDLDGMCNQLMWENGVLCEEYDGNTFVLTQISCYVNADTHHSVGGQRFTTNGILKYDITIQEIDVMISSEISATLQFFEDNNTNLRKWLENL